MNILIISSSYLPRIGGLEVFVGDLAQFFLKNGHQIKIITQKYPRRLKNKEFINGIEISRYLFFDPKIERLSFRIIGAYIYTLLLAPINLVKFIFSVKSFKPDIINFHFVGAPTLFLLIYSKLFNTKLIVSLHGADVMALLFKSKMPISLFTKILKKADFVTTNSLYILNRANKIAPFIKDKSKVIYNGINREELRNVEPYQHKNKYVLSIGRLVNKKGFDVLIEAFNVVTKEIQDIDLIIAGDGPERDFLEKTIKKLNLEDRVKLYGLVNREEVLKLLKGCEFLILPSREEAFGIVILEAMACIKPVVATRSGGPEEIIEDGINGLLVDKENFQELAEAITNLLNDIELRDRILKNSQDIIQNFDIANAGKKYLDIFRKCV